MLQIPALDKLVHELSRLPGIGPKTAQRLAYHILKNGLEQGHRLAEGVMRVHSEVKLCPQCFNYTDLDLCKFCADAHRSDEIICVVEEPMDISRIESSGAFRGRYHVLHGSISPLEGVLPDQLKIAELIKRIDSSLNGDSVAPIKEIILALDSDLEGDATTLYLAQKFSEKKIKVSRLAHGIPIGSDIDFVDERTMGRALENRMEV